MTKAHTWGLTPFRARKGPKRAKYGILGFFSSDSQTKERGSQSIVKK